MTAPPYATATAEMDTLEAEDLPNYDEIIIEDGKPVDSIISEKQMKLLTTALYASWAGPGEGRPFVALANVGLFYSAHLPPLVPDVMLSLDVSLPQDMRPKKNRSYFMWEYGRPPSVVIEVVSNRDGGEDGYKLVEYASIGVAYYAIFDPLGYIQSKPLRLFVLTGRFYQEREPGWMPDVGLGLALWEGTFEGLAGTWLRWCDQEGRILLTGPERAALSDQRAAQAEAEREQERQRAEQAEREREEERVRAEQAEQRLAQLEAKLRQLGLEP